MVTSKLILKPIVIIMTLTSMVLSAKAQCSCECCSKKTITSTASYWNTSSTFLTESVISGANKPFWREGRFVDYLTKGKQGKGDTVTRDFWKETDTTTLSSVRNKMDVIGFSTIEESGKLAHYPVNKTDSLIEVVNYVISYTWKKTIIELKGKLIKTIEPNLVVLRKTRDKTPVKYIYHDKEIIPLEIFYQTKRKPLE